MTTVAEESVFDVETYLQQHYRRLHLRVVRATRLYGPDAEDVSQEVVLRVLTRDARFAGEDDLLRWSATVARNLVRDEFASARHRREVLHDVVPADTGRAAPDVADLVVIRERLAAVFEAVAALPPSYRAVWWLSEVDGLSAGEVAGLLDVTKALVYVRLSRAKQSLRVALRTRPDLWPGVFLPLLLRPCRAALARSRWLRLEAFLAGITTLVVAATMGATPRPGVAPLQPPSRSNAMRRGPDPVHQPGQPGPARTAIGRDGGGAATARKPHGPPQRPAADAVCLRGRIKTCVDAPLPKAATWVVVVIPGPVAEMTGQSGASVRQDSVPVCPHLPSNPVVHCTHQRPS